MKSKFLRSKLSFLFCLTVIAFSISTQRASAALNGIYTIDSSQVASSTNYRDFLSAVSDLKVGTRTDGGTPNGAGVTGPVTFNVAAGTFVGQLDITAITGASLTNTITFDGGFGNASTRIVQANPTALATAFTIKINNAQFINLRNITIRGAGTTYGWPLHIFNVSSNVKVKNCIIDFTSALTLHINNNFCALVINNSTASPTSATTSLINLEIDSNRLVGGYGNYFYGATTNTGIFMRGNTIDSVHYYGLYIYGLAQMKINNNTINMKTAGDVNSFGININSCTPTAGNFQEVNANKLINCGSYGIYINSANGQTTPRCQLNNNAIGGGFRNTGSPYGIYFNSSYSWDVFNNSVNLDAIASSSAAALYIGNCCTQGTTLLDVRNNIFAVTGIGNSAYTLYMPNGYPYAVTGTSGLNYNNFYKQGAGNNDPLIYSGGTILTPSTFINNSSYNTNSVSINPLFTSAKNLQPISPCNNGVQITGLTTSINNVTRNNPPDLGAYEVNGVNNDVGVERIISPALPFNAGTQNVSVLLRNFGSNTVTFANVYYNVNQTFPIMQTWSGSLAACASATVTFSGSNQYNFIANTQYNVKAYTDLPNGFADAVTINDTVTIPVIFPALSGNYTIDQGSPASNTNFVSFATAALALNNGGVNGPVVFTVMGTTPYVEQFTLSNIQGVSATNTITFDGGNGNASNRIISFAASLQAASHTIRIDNTQWVRIRNLTIRGTGATYAWPMHIFGNNASNTQIRSCIIDYVGGSGVNGTSDNFSGIVINNSTTGVSSSSTAINMDIDSNSVIGGQNGIYYYGQTSTGINIRNNTITNANQYGVYVYYTYGLKCNNNIINMRITGSASSYGMYIFYLFNNGINFHEVMNNVITDAGQYGIYFYYLQGGTSNLAKVVNNMVGGTFRSTDASAMYFTNSSYANVWFNSMVLDNATTGAQSAVVRFISGNSSIDFRNNNLASTNASVNNYVLYADATSSFSILNYNNYYKLGNPTIRFIALNATNYHIGNYKGALGYNNNSVSIDPTYTTNKNLRTSLICNNGVTIPSVTTDIDGELRNSPPDIGCDENLSASSMDLSVSAISAPTLPLAIGTQNIGVVIKNNGTGTITSATVNYQINGGTLQTIYWSGTLNACDSQTVVFNATSGPGSSDQRYTFLPGFAYSILAYTAIPNGSTDLIPTNDTARINNVCTGLSGAFTIDIAATPNATTFNSFTSAINALNCGGITGPVVFNVEAGTYTGQLDLSAVQGSSAINTIVFDGGAGNAATRIVNFAATSTALPFTFRLNNTQFVTLRNLTIRGSGTTTGWPLHIFGTSNAIGIKNCRIDFTGNGLVGTSDNYVGIVMNNFASAPNATSGTSISTNIEIDSNVVIGGNTGIYLIGNGANTGIFCRNNTIDSANTSGIYVTNIIGPKVNNNTIEMRSVSASASSQGIYFTSVSSNALYTTEVIGNRIIDAALYGIYLNSCSGISTARSQMINNSFGGGFRNASPYGMYFTSSNFWNIWFNTVNIDNAASGSTSAAYFTSTSSNDCRNNNFAITHASASINMFPFRSLSGSSFIALNYNNYHKSAFGLQHIQVNGTNFDTITYNTTTLGGGMNSVRINPIFTSSKNLLPITAIANGQQLVEVPTDILTLQRNNPPTIGAYEVASSAAVDLGIVSVLTPDTFVSAGIQPVVLTVKNFGLTTVTSFNIRHTVNGLNLQDSAFSGVSLATNDVLQIVLAGTKSANITPAVLTTFKVYIHNPNGSTDNNLVNDTVTRGPKISALKGIYTINPSGSGSTNFTSFRNAVNALNLAGVGGAVTFNVSAATYNEQITIGAINGVSATNTITFNGGVGNAATRIIDTAANTAASFWTVKLNAATYVTFRNLTIRSSGATYANAVHIYGNSNFCKFKNCVLEITGAGVTSTSTNYVPVIINNSTSITSLTTGSQVNNLELDSNTINNGYYGIYAYGNTSTPYAFNNKFRYNNIINSYYNGVFFYYHDGMNISNNLVNMRIASVSSTGLSLNQCYTSGTNFHTVNANKIINAGQYGIYAFYYGSAGSVRHSLANNMIAGGFRVNGSYGISLQYSNNVDVFNNSVNVDFAQTGSDQYSAFYLYSGASIDVRNNIFANTGGITNIGIPVYIGSIPTGVFRLDNNVYYKPNATSSNLIYAAGTYYNAQNFVDGGGYNTFSYNKNPSWVSSNDLHITEGCTRGSTLPGIVDDIDGNPRFATSNYGADEYTGFNNDIGTVSIAPFSVGAQNVRVVIRNYGSNTITSANVSYSVNGGLAKTAAWSGSLAPCDTVTVVFSGSNQYTFLMGVSYQITAYTSNPNLATDPKLSNDTVILGPSCVFLSGNYTINASGSGVTNFTSFASAAAALTCGGVSSPVKFMVAPGTYNEQITLPAIPGSSNINTVTFDGDSAANRIITFAATINTEYHTIRLNTASNVFFRNLTIQSNGANYGGGVHLMGACNNVKIKNCIVQITGAAASSASGAFAPIVLNNSTDGNNMTSAGSQSTGVEIDSNRIVGGYYGIVLSSNTGSPYLSNTIIRKNTIDSSYYYGIYVYYNNGITFNNNNINMRVNGSTGSQGVYFYFNPSTGSNIFSVIGNKVMNAGQYGMYLYYTYTNTSANRSICANNMIGGTFRNTAAVGLYCSNLNYWDIWNNSVNLDIATSASTSSAMYINAGGTHDVRNNMLVYSASSGSGQALNVSAASILTTLDYNNYVNNSSSNLLTIGSNTYTTSNFINGGGYNTGSKNQNPGFVSTSDLHIGSACINGIQIATIPTDIDGQTRAVPPDIGCDEFIGLVNNDIGASFIITPQSPFTAGTQDVRVRLNNYGANTVTSATIKYSVNGGSLKTFAWTGSLAPCDTTSVLFTGANQFNFVFGNSYTIKAYSEQPNNLLDANRGNDTISSTICPAFNGNYTINPSGSGPNNFTSISAAANAISCGGVTGPVLFTIAAGNYNEQVTINPIPGASAINTITFDGGAGNAATRILNYAPTIATLGHTIQLNSCPYVTVKNLTIISNGASFGTPVHVMGSSNYSKVKNCIITFGSAAQTSTNGGYIGVLVNGFNNVQSPTGNGSYVIGLEIDSNKISYGYYGIVTFGVSATPYSNNNFYRNNTIDSSYYYGFYAYYQDGLKLINNTINLKANGSANSNGIYMYVCYTSGSNFHEVIGNKIINAGQYGMYIYFTSNPSGARGKMINNMIGGGFRINSATGLYMYYCDYWDIWNNTVNLDFATNSNTYSAFSGNYSTLDIRNNHFVYSATSGTGLPFYLSTTTTALNYNNYFNASSTNLLYYGSTTYTNTTFVGGGGMNTNSVNLNPQFASKTNLRGGGCIKGIAIAGVTNDIDGDLRGSIPDIGADESLTNDAGVIAITAPTQPLTPGFQNVVVVIKNFGNNTITSLNVNYNINGTGVVTQSLTGLTLLPCSTQVVTFSGSQQYNFNGAANAVIYTSAPNGLSDNFKANDTLKQSLCGALNGIYTINASGSGGNNFTSFSAALNNLVCAGITGPVVFNVAAGTYAEQLDIIPISGASATNTITFNGGAGNAATRVLTYAASINNLRHTIRFNACQYITFKNITIQNTGSSFGWGVHYFGAAHNNAVKNCIIDIAGANAPTSTSNAFIGVVGSASATSETSSQQLQNVVLDSNTINNGYYGIILYGNTSTQSTGTLIRNNTINGAYYYSTYLYAQDGFAFNFNTLTNRTGVFANANNMGLNLSSCTATSSNFYEINGNKISDIAQYGIYFNAVNSSTTRCRIWNNMIGGGFTSPNSYGIYFTGTNWDIYQNTITMDASTTNAQYAALYVGGGSNNKLRNNILTYTALGGVGLPFYTPSTTYFTSPASINYNMYYKAGLTGTNTLIYVGGNYNLTNFTTGGANTNSISINPIFFGSKNLHIYDGCYNGDSLGVTMDADGDTRASYADIGADEVPNGADDIGVKQLLKPTVPLVSGLQDIIVLVKNYGTNTVIGGTVKYSVNGATPVVLNFTDTILPCATDTIKFVGVNQYNFVGGSTYGIKVYTEQPNSTTDTNKGNDTLTIPPVCVGMSGVFTINPSGSGLNNFTSFTNAVNALLCGGVGGPVTFNVSAGTYTEQVVIPTIPGASTINQIIFDGGAGNAATRVLTFNATTTNSRHNVRFDNTSYIQFRNLTIRGTNTTQTWPVHVNGTCNNLKIKNCVIEITGAGATTNSTNFIPVCIANSFNSPYNQSLVDSIEIDSNIINGGYASIWDYNSNGTVNRFRGNTLNNPVVYGMYIYSSSEVKIQNNIINMWNLGPNTSMGIYLYSSNTSGTKVHEINGNKFFDLGQYGVYSYFSSGNFSYPGKIYNNMIAGGFRNTSTHSGLQIEYSNYWNIDFNSIISDTATTGLCGAINIVNSSSNNVRNNILSVTNATSQAIPFYAATTGNVTTLNYNNYYKAGSPSPLIYVGNNFSPTTFIGGSGFNLNSINRDPVFVSNRDLHINNSCNNGIAIAGITTDLDGNTRNTPPDMGADEVTGGVNDNLGVTVLSSPKAPISIGSQTVSVVISNLGNNIVTTANINYTINGGAPITQSWFGTLNPCDTTTIVFSIPFTTVFGSAYTLKVYTSIPNGTTDGNTLDDTLTFGPFCPALGGNYTIDAAGSGASNYTSFTAAAAAIQCGGIYAPVTFTVANGTYIEQVNIGNVTGVNDTTRVTFIGQSQNGVILTYNATNTANSHTLRLNASSYVNFYNMTIQAAGTTYGTAVHLLGASNFVKIKNCNIRISGAGANGTSQYFIPLLINGNSDISNLTLNGTSISNIEIDSNKIYSGYYSIYYYGRTSTPYSQNNKFRRNTIDSSYYNAVYTYYAEGFKFLNNNVNVRINGTTGSMGLQMNNCYNTGINFHDVSGNKITGAGQYGVYTYFASGVSASVRSIFTNNLVGAGFRSTNASGLYWQYSDYWNIFNNTVNLDFATNSAQYAAANFYYYTNYNLDIRNNIFNYTATSGTGIPFYLSGISTITSFNYNNFYNGASTNLIYLNGTTYTTGTYVGGSGYNTASTNVNSPFVGTYDLHLTAASSKGVTITSVTNDFDNESRQSPPDMGADEYYSALDIGVLGIDSPTTNFCGTTKNIVVKIKNYGNQNVTSATINWTVNGVPQSPYSWSGSLGTGLTSAQIVLGNYNYTSGGTFIIDAFTSYPNGSTDINANNDSAHTSINVTPSVVPTISIVSNYTTICSGLPVTMTATITNGGTSPTYQWRNNGITVGTNSNIFTSSSLANNDSIICIISSSAACATPTNVVSNYVKMNVGTSVVPDVSIVASTTVICAGGSVGFTATPVYGGTSPSYQWKRNGLNVGTNSDTYTPSVINNNDSFTVVLTSSLGCAIPSKDTSNFIKITVNPILIPSVSVTAYASTICSGVVDTFTAVITNPGTLPFYQWKKNNNVNIGTNSNKLITSSLSDNDSIYVFITSNALCASPTNATSNKIAMVVIPSVIPTSVVTATASTICNGTSVKFNVANTNGGSAPSLVWKKNGVTIATNIDSVITSTLVNNDTVYVQYTSNAVCASPTFITSNKLITTVNPILTPSVSIAPSASTACAGSSITFTATPLFGGTTPSYQWYKNGIAVGTDSIKYTSTTFANNDSITVVMTSSEICKNKASDTSSSVKLIINPLLVPTATVTATATTICAGSSIKFNLASTNGGTSPGIVWKRNTVTIATNVDSVITSTLSNGDSVYAVLTSNATCAAPTNVNSNKIGITVNPIMVPTAIVTATETSICSGSSVKFKVVTTNGGTTPTLVWKKNGATIATGIDSVITSALANNDSVYVEYTSNAVCAAPAFITSNKIIITISSTIVPSVSISPSTNNTCGGTSITFTATPVNGGITPSYKWYKNGFAVGTDSMKYTSSSFVNNDSITVVLTSSISCKDKLSDTSASVKMIITPLVLPTVIVTPSQTSICVGGSITFTAAITNGGSTPVYQWKKNGVNVGTNSNTFITSAILGTDSFSVVLTSNATCLSANNIASNKVVISVGSSLIPSVNITVTDSIACHGVPITFTALGVNGGVASYQWKKNSVNIGTNSNQFVSGTLATNDTISVIMTSSLTCASPLTATSNKIRMTINQYVTPSLKINLSANNICSGTSVNFTAVDSNGGTAPVHTWLKNGLVVGTNSPNYSSLMSFGDVVKCVLNSNEYCLTSLSDTFGSGLIIKKIPAKPIITKSGDTLISTIASSYQWMLNNANITGATAQKYKATANGPYKVIIDSIGCQNTSDIFNATNISVRENIGTEFIQLLPNPTLGNVFLNAQFTSSDETVITVFDMTGKEIIRLAKGRTAKLEGEVIDLSNMKPAVYLVHVLHGNKLTLHKVVKAN